MLLKVASAAIRNKQRASLLFKINLIIKNNNFIITLHIMGNLTNIYYVFTQPVVLRPRKNVRTETVVIESGTEFANLYDITYKYGVSSSTVSLWRHIGVLKQLLKDA